MTSDIVERLRKLDEKAVDGLLGVEDSLAYEVTEIERHFHSRGYWYGKDPGDSFLLDDGLVPWRLTAGNGGAYGNWIQLSEGTEIVAGTHYDPHLILISAASAAGSLYYVQFGIGAGGAQVVVAMSAFQPQAQLRNAPVVVQSRRVLSSSLLWARCNSATNGATLDLVIGIHVYEG